MKPSASNPAPCGVPTAWLPVTVLCALGVGCADDVPPTDREARSAATRDDPLVSVTSDALPTDTPASSYCDEATVLTIGPGLGALRQRWSIDDTYDYCAGWDFANLNEPAGLGSTVLGTLGFEPEQGVWDGSFVSIDHTLDGPGTYTVVPAATLRATAGTAPDTPLVAVSVQAGIATIDPVRSSGWEGASGSVRVSVDGDGTYHFHQPTGLTLLVGRDDLSGGIPDRPGTIEVSFTDLSGTRTGP